MKKAYLAAIAIALVVIVALVYASTPLFKPMGTPPIIVPYSYNFSVLNPQVIKITDYLYDNVTQGLPLQINLTFTSKNNQPLSIPIENVTLTSHNSTSYPFQEKAFNYSLSQNPLIIQPNSSNSATLTINLADKIPLGYYTVGINLGTVEEIYANKTYSVTFYGTFGFDIIVTPKPTQS